MPRRWNDPRPGTGSGFRMQPRSGWGGESDADRLPGIRPERRRLSCISRAEDSGSSRLRGFVEIRGPAAGRPDRSRTSNPAITAIALAKCAGALRTHSFTKRQECFRLETAFRCESGEGTRLRRLKEIGPEKANFPGPIGQESAINCRPTRRRRTRPRP